MDCLNELVGSTPFELMFELNKVDISEWEGGKPNKGSPYIIAYSGT
jgi:hypothetical protein